MEDVFTVVSNSGRITGRGLERKGFFNGSAGGSLTVLREGRLRGLLKISRCSRREV